MDTSKIETIRKYFATQPVQRAWLFGSCARGEDTQHSDIDLLVQFYRGGRPVTLLTYARMWRDLRDKLGCDVDLVEDGTLESYAVESVNQDKFLIYERES